MNEIEYEYKTQALFLLTQFFKETLLAEKGETGKILDKYATKFYELDYQKGAIQDGRSDRAVF